MVQLLGLCAPKCRGPGFNPWLIPGRGTKIPHVAQWPKKKRFTLTAMLKKDRQGMKDKSGSRETS